MSSNTRPTWQLNLHWRHPVSTHNLSWQTTLGTFKDDKYERDNPAGSRGYGCNKACLIRIPFNTGSLERRICSGNYLYYNRIFCRKPLQAVKRWSHKRGLSVLMTVMFHVGNTWYSWYLRYLCVVAHNKTWRLMAQNKTWRLMVPSSVEDREGKQCCREPSWCNIVKYTMAGSDRTL